MMLTCEYMAEYDIISQSYIMSNLSFADDANHFGENKFEIRSRVS